MKFITRLAIAAVALLGVATTQANAAEKESIRVCVGSKAGNYYFAGGEIAKFLPNYRFVPVFTNGAVESMQGLRDGRCDWAFTQKDVQEEFIIKNPDLMNDLKVIASLYKEGLHIVCNRAAKVDRITEIPKRKLKLAGLNPGGGTMFTTNKLLGADVSLYKDVEIVTDADATAIMASLDSSEGQCFAFMAGLNTPLMISANEMSKMNGGKPKLKLIAVDDRDMKKMKDSKGNPLYDFKELNDDGKLYPNLLDDEVEIPFTSANLVTRKGWWEGHRNAQMDVTDAIRMAMPTIRKRTNPLGQDF
jgi:TRAP-type uncharacterized transport system substrate-binding protein